MRVRPATRADAPAIARVHVASWRSTYRGIIPDGYLDSLTAADRLPAWRARLQRPPARLEHVLVAADGQGRIHGFATSRPVAPGEQPGIEEAGASAELYQLYLDPGSVGRGIGGLLHSDLVERWLAQGCTCAVLWVAPANTRARRFYEAHGWRSDDIRRDEPMWGTVVTVVRYHLEVAPAGEGVSR